MVTFTKRVLILGIFAFIGVSTPASAGPQKEELEKNSKQKGFLYLLNLIPAETAFQVYELRYGDLFSQEPFKTFNQQLFAQLDFSNLPEPISHIFPILIPQYIQLKLQKKLKTAKDCLEFKEKVESFIHRGNDPNLDQMTRDEALRDAMKEGIKISGPHAIKQFQLFSSKDKSFKECKDL